MLCGIAGIEQRFLKTQLPISRRGLHCSSRIRACLFPQPQPQLLCDKRGQP